MPNESNVRQLTDHGAPIYPITDRSLVIGLQDNAFATYVMAWDGASTPVPANIPAGVVVTYNGTDYTGTLAASASTAQDLYLVASGSQPGEYDRYITTHVSSTYAWNALGSTAIVSPVIADDLVTNDSSKALSAKQGKILGDKTSELEAKVDENATYSSDTREVDIATNATANKYIKTGISDGATVDMTPLDSQSYQYVTHPVTAGEQIKIKGGGGGNPRLWAFVDGDNKLLLKADADACETTYLTLTAPADGTLICDALMGDTYSFSVLVNVQQSVSVKDAVSDLYNKAETLEEDVSTINGEITKNEYEGEVLASINLLRTGLTPRADFSGYDEGGRWLYVGNSAYGYRLLFVKSGEEISIKAGSSGSQYAFIADLVKPVNLAAIGYVEGTSRVTIPGDATRTVTVPEDCYLYILTKFNNNSNYTPASLTINGIEQLTTIVGGGGSSELPKGVLVYSASNSRFTFYGRREGTNQYFSFRIQHKIDHSELEYADLWHLTKGHLCNYTNGVFTDVCETIDDAENEMAMKFSGKADFTGGYHGDERIDIDASSYVHFFADGKLISDLSADFEMECASFGFVQYSTLHETTNDGTTPVSGHPIVAYHFKRTTFENGRFSVENSIKMASAQTVTTAFAGLFCTDKNVASVAIIPFAQEIQMDGDNSQHSANNKPDETVVFYDGTNKVECVAEGHFLQGYDDVTDVNYFLVWDRTVDSKYYRGNSLSKSFNTGDIIRNEFTAIFK